MPASPAPRQMNLHLAVNAEPPNLLAGCFRPFVGSLNIARGVHGDIQI